MFKKFALSLVCASMVLTSLPTYSAPFGSTKAAPTRSAPVSAQRTAPARIMPSNATRSAPQAAPTQSGSISGGQSVGMTRSGVTQSIRDGSYKQTAPANNTTVAGSNPQNRNTQTAPVNNGGYNYNQNNQGYQGNYQTPPAPRTYGMGTVAAAAAAGALAGYLLHRDSSGNTYYTNPNQPGLAYDANGNRMSSVPQGNYQNMGTVAQDGSYSVSPSQSGGYPSTMASTQSHSGFSFMWFLLILLIIAALAYFFFFRNRNPSTSMGATTMPFTSFKNPEEKLRDDADQMFMDFQKSNRPSQLSHIQTLCTPMLFDAIKDTVVSSSENRDIKIKTLEHELVNLEQEGTGFVASMRYRSTMEEAENGTVTKTTMDENWNYVYNDSNGSKWLLAGIEQVVDPITEVLSQNTGAAPNASKFKF